VTPDDARDRRDKRRSDALDRHLDRLYRRIDELNGRVGRLERALWVGLGGLGAIATFNLYSNVTGGG